MKTRYTIKTIHVALKACEPEGSIIRESETAVKMLREIFSGLDADQEHFVILTLDKGNRVTGYKVCCSGGVSEAFVDSRIVFRNALLMGATSLILAHNHPSGRNTPSPEDLTLTRSLSEGGKLLGIKILDHIILAGTGYFSFQEGSLL